MLHMSATQHRYVMLFISTNRTHTRTQFPCTCLTLFGINGDQSGAFRSKRQTHLVHLPSLFGQGRAQTPWFRNPFIMRSVYHGTRRTALAHANAKNTNTTHFELFGHKHALFRSVKRLQLAEDLLLPKLRNIDELRLSFVFF